MGRHAIFINFDDGVLRYARACIRSLLRNYRRHPELLVLYHGDCGETRSWLRGLDRVRLLDPEAYSIDVGGFPTKAHQNPVTYMRYVLWTDRFDEYDRILYLDCDTLVLKPLDELFAMEGFFVVSNHYPMPEGGMFPAGSESDPELSRLLAEDGLSYPGSMDDMGNTGVFVIPREYRGEKQFRDLVSITLRYSAFNRYADQGAIGVWCLHRGIRPARRWEYNFQTPFVVLPTVRTKLRHARIVHFSGMKPDDPGFLDWVLTGNKGRKLRRLFERYARNDRRAFGQASACRTTTA